MKNRRLSDAKIMGILRQAKNTLAARATYTKRSCI